MKKHLIIFLSAAGLFCPLFLTAAEGETETEAPPPQTIIVEEDDVIVYPHTEEPVEATASLNSLRYACTIGPGDFFKVSYHSLRYTSLTKTAGRKGDQTYCHKGAHITVKGTNDLMISQEGVPESLFRIFYPFVLDEILPGGAQTLKTLTITGDMPEGSQGFLIKEGDIFTYPVNADPLETEALMNKLSFRCDIMPGDSFWIPSINNYPSHRSDDELETKIMLRKSDGAAGSQTVCPVKASIFSKLAGCRLKRTEDGVPEGVICPPSPTEIIEKLARNSFDS